MNRLNAGEGVRFVLAVWPEVWDWLVRLTWYLGDLPRLPETSDKTVPRNPDSTELQSILKDVAHLGYGLTNGELRKQVLQRIERAFTGLAGMEYSREHGNGERLTWVFQSCAYNDFADGQPVTVRPLEDPEIIADRTQTARTMLDHLVSGQHG